MAMEDPRFGDVSGVVQMGANLPRTWGRYMLLHALAQGGMGAIFIAKYAGGAGFERYCVIKTLRRQFTEDPDATARFLDEARVVAQLQHANICTVFDVGQVEGRYYLAMDYIAGFDAHALQRRCQQVGAQLPPGLLAYIMGEVLDALDYAHRLQSPTTGTPLGIVHRDISPTNVMISFEGEVKLIDFGMALSSIKNQRTEPTLLVGKVAYMAPEQATGDPVDARADQFAAAVVFYELMTGEEFYAGIENKQAIWTRAALGDHRPPSWNKVDEGLKAILERALAKDRAARFATCADFRSALDAYAWSAGWRGSKAELRKLMAERFALEMTTQRRLLFSFSDVHVAPTLEVLGQEAAPRGLPAPAAAVPTIVAEASERVAAPPPVSLPVGTPLVAPTAIGAHPAEVTVPGAHVPRAVPAAVSSVGGAPVAAPAPVAAAPPPPPPPPPAQPVPQPFRDMPSTRPPLQAVGPRPVTAVMSGPAVARVETPPAPTSTAVTAPPLAPPPHAPPVPPVAQAALPEIPPPPEALPEPPAALDVPTTDVVQRPDRAERAAPRRRRRRPLLAAALVVLSALALWVPARLVLEPRGLWPAALARLEGAARAAVTRALGRGARDADAGVTASVDAGAVPAADGGALLATGARDGGPAVGAPLDAGAAPADAGALVDPGGAPDAGGALAVDAGAAPGADAGAAEIAAADAGIAATSAPPRGATVAHRMAWLEARCPALACVDDAARQLARKRPTRAQRQLAERAVDRCVARCSEADAARK